MSKKNKNLLNSTFTYRTIISFTRQFSALLFGKENKKRRAGNLKIELSLSTAVRHFIFSFFPNARTIGVVTYFFQPLSLLLVARKKQIKIGKNSVEFYRNEFSGLLGIFLQVLRCVVIFICRGVDPIFSVHAL